MNKDEFLKTIPQMEKIYVLYSALTKSVYVSCDNEERDDEVLMFSDEKLCEDKRKELEAQKILTRHVIVEKDQSRDFFYELAVFYGMNRISFTTQEGTFVFALDEAIERPDFTKIPENLRPLRNPQLQLSMMYFMQEARKMIPKEERDDELLVDLQEEMIANLARSLYLMPAMEEEVDGQKIMKLILIKMNDGSQMVPILADSACFAHFVGKTPVKGLRAFTVNIDRLASIDLPPEAKGFILNPQDVNVPMPKEFVDRLSKF